MPAAQPALRGSACLAALLTAVTLLGLLPAASDARRKATAAEARALWRTADPSGKCQHHRPVVSTVKSKRYRFALITIADRNCGNGQAVMRRPKSGGRWAQMAIGSDWGASDLCATALRRVPRSVLTDLFGNEVC